MSKSYEKGRRWRWLPMVVAALVLLVATPATAFATGPVALDAGHGGSDSGAVGNGLKESDLTWKITNYAKERLGQLGVPTVMTRTSANSNPSLYSRNQTAVNAGARALVSFHINSGGGFGSEALVANNADFNRFTATETQSFGRDVLSRLSSMGFTNRGNKLRNYPNGSTVTYYASAQHSDYYAIVRNARASGFSGVIIEFGFIDNGGDALKFKSDANLKSMGYAAAEAIAKQWPNSYSKPAASRYSSRWVKSGDRWCWFDVSGSYGTWAYNRWITSGGHKYYIDGSGYMVTGWASVGGKWYWFDGSGAMRTGWIDLSGKRYLLGSDGAMLTGWQQQGGKWYWFDGSGAMARNHWQGNYYLGSDGVMMTNAWVDDSHYVGADGKLVAGKTRGGWVQDAKGWRYDADGGGSYVTDGWKKVGNCWYLFGKDGYMLTGWQQVKGARYYLRPSGAMQTGWMQSGNTWYWFGTSGAMAENGAVQVNGKLRLFDASGAWVTGSGWRKLGDTWYWLDSDVVHTGWLKRGTLWFYMGSNGAMATGWQKVGNCWYYFNAPDGAMATGWKQLDGTWYFLQDSGAMKTGWLKRGSTWYYFNGSGAMLTGWQRIGGSWYYLNVPNGDMAVGWKQLGGKWYFLQDSGAMKTGWLQRNGRWYYFDGSGVMVTGTQTIGGTRYEFEASGAMKEQPKRVGWYDASYSPSSNAVSGSKVHYYDANGNEVYTRTTNTPIMGSPQMAKNTFVANLAKLVSSNYPDIYRKDAKYGATTPEAFATAVWDAATKEGVRPEVLAAQVGNETGWLRFGGIVNADQCNFGGIGALDGNENGNAATFPNVQTGLLAQAQHLKAYASKAALNQSCVDPRFHLVTRGNCPYVEDLGNGNWASSKLYGRDLLAAMKQVQQG